MSQDRPRQTVAANGRSMLRFFHRIDSSFSPRSCPRGPRTLRGPRGSDGHGRRTRSQLGGRVVEGPARLGDDLDPHDLHRERDAGPGRRALPGIHLSRRGGRRPPLAGRSRRDSRRGCGRGPRRALVVLPGVLGRPRPGPRDHSRVPSRPSPRGLDPNGAASGGPDDRQPPRRRSWRPVAGVLPCACPGRVAAPADRDAGAVAGVRPAVGAPRTCAGSRP